MRRRKHEGSLGALTQPRSPVDPAEELSWTEVLALLDEEIVRLREIYRSVFVLCCIENISREEAARRLGLKPGTVSSRLTTARKRLAKRLAGRGVELGAVMAASTLAAEQATALSPVLVASTIKAALGEKTTGVTSASVAEMIRGATAEATLSKAKMVAAVLLAAGVLAGAGAWAYRTSATPQPAELPAQTPSSVVGRVLDATRKPLAGIQVSLQFAESRPDELIRQHNLYHWDKEDITNADGRFRLEGLFPGLEFSVFASRPGHRSVAVAFDGVRLKSVSSAFYYCPEDFSLSIRRRPGTI